MIYATRHPDNSLPNREDLAAYSANKLEGYFLAADPDGKLGLSNLLQNVWRGRKKAQAQDTSSGPVPPTQGLEAKPAEAAIAPPPVSAELLEALKPLARVVYLYAHNKDAAWFDSGLDPDTGEPEGVTVGQLRAVIKAAGLWTPRMQAADTTQPQADRVETDVEIVAGDLAHRDNPAGQGQVDDDQEF